MKSKFYYLFLPFFLFCLPVKADPISLIRPDQCETIIEVYVEGDQIRVTFEIGLMDLKYFKDIISKDFLNEEIKKFIAFNKSKNITTYPFLMEVDGVNLIGEIVRQEIQPRKYRASLYTGQVDDNLKISKEVLFTEVVYKTNKKAKIVKFSPPLQDGYQTTFANIGFVTYHKKIPVNDLRYLSRQINLTLDWEDPWYSKFENRNLRRHHQSSLMSFLYVDPYEVRHEVMMRVKDLEEWIDLGYELDDYIEVEELESLKTKIANFLVDRNVVTIDGETERPIIDKIHYVKWSLSGIQILELKERMDYSSAVIGVIFVYPNKGIPENISIKWDMFSEKVTEVPNVATDPAGPMPYVLKPDDDVLIWKNYLNNYKLPAITEMEVTSAQIPILQILAILLMLYGVVSLVKNRQDFVKYGSVAGIGILMFIMGYYITKSIEFPFIEKTSFSKPEASSLINHLLKNTYRAFDFREESDIYDKLAISNDDKLLAEIYIQTKKSMKLKSQGGIEVKLKDVEILEVEEVPTDGEGISFKCKWIVRGDVGHWGHIHSRTNQYYAILNVKNDNGIWKLNDIDIIEEVRL